MSRQRAAQSLAASVEQPTRALDSTHRPRQLKGWRSIKQLAAELDFVTTAPTDPEDACRTWLRRQGIVGVRRGRVILVDGLDVDAALRKS